MLPTVDDIKSCSTHNKEYAILPIVWGPEGNAGFISSTEGLRAQGFRA